MLACAFEHWRLIASRPCVVPPCTPKSGATRCCEAHRGTQRSRRGVLWPECKQNPSGMWRAATPRRKGRRKRHIRRADALRPSRASCAIFPLMRRRRCAWDVANLSAALVVLGEPVRLRVSWGLAVSKPHGRENASHGGTCVSLGPATQLLGSELALNSGTDAAWLGPRLPGGHGACARLGRPSRHEACAPWCPGPLAPFSAGPLDGVRRLTEALSCRADA